MVSNTHDPRPSVMQTPPRTRWRARVVALPDWIWLPGLLVLHGICAVIVMQRGFLEYNADGYTRIIRGHEWLQSPRWEVSVWLPLQTWLFGSGLFVYDALDVTPRVISFLLSLATVANLFLIGRTIGGRWAGVIAAALAAIFPWVVWFGVSGMAEAPFHATLTLGVVGFVSWLNDPRDRWLVVAALGFSLSTMVRYEGWFYAATYLVLIGALAWRGQRLRISTLALAAVPMLFPLVWIEQYWQRYDDPFGFARETADIKSSLDSANASAGLWDKLSAYPEATVRLAPWLGLLCALALAYALYRRVAWWPVIALVCGQALLLVGVSAGFANLGPGAERYLISNFILLFPILGASIMLLPRFRVRIVAVGATALISITVVRTLLNPPTWYPDADVRAVADVAEDRFANASDTHDRVPVLLPHAPAEGFNASYALRILSSHPDDWIITSDPVLFTAVLNTTEPPFWLLDTDSGIAPPAGWHIERVGRYLVGSQPGSGGQGTERVERTPDVLRVSRALE